MKIKVLKNEKNELEVQVDNLTIVEVLREYLHKDSSVEFAAWKREHPNEAPVLRIETKGKTAKKALNDAIDSVSKEANKLVAVVKKA